MQKIQLMKESLNLSMFDVDNKNVRYSKIKCCIDNISIENHWLPNMYAMSLMHKSTINVGFVIVPP